MNKVLDCLRVGLRDIGSFEQEENIVACELLASYEWFMIIAQDHSGVSTRDVWHVTWGACLNLSLLEIHPVEARSIYKLGSLLSHFPGSLSRTTLGDSAG